MSPDPAVERASCPPPRVSPSLCEVWLVQGSLAVLGHVSPMACSKKEASEGWLLSGPLLRGLLSGLMPRGPGYFLQSCKIIAITGACLPEGQLASMGQGRKRTLLRFLNQGLRLPYLGLVVRGHGLSLWMLKGGCPRSRCVREPWDC